MKKVIKTADEYEAALSSLHSLLDSDPHGGSDVADEVELLALLISTYEKSEFEHLPAPTAIEAIRFRMEQLGLVQKDLVRYVGSPGRVSEVLSGKRALTIPMIRALASSLHIPASTLINTASIEDDVDDDLPWDRFPTREMARRGWIPSKDATSSLRQFVKPALPYAAAFRRTMHFRGSRNVDKLALLAWVAHVWRRAVIERKGAPTYNGSLTAETLKDVARLSWSERGPLLACEFLHQRGIIVIVEPAMPKTFLDGATIFTDQGPVIGLTLRFDRLDSFWYTLLHELAHACLHANKATVFFDDVEAGVADELEVEADAMASEILVPRTAWQSSPASRLRSKQAAEHLARQLQISPAIVAGKIRREFNDFRVLSDLVGQRSVRRLFSDIEWQEK